MKKIMSLILSLVMLLSLGGVVTVGAQDTEGENNGPTIEKLLRITVTDELDYPVSDATVEILDEEDTVIGTYVSSEEGTISALLQAGTYTLKITDVPEGYIFGELSDTVKTIEVSLEEAEIGYDISADTHPSTVEAHRLFCNHTPSHLEHYVIYDGVNEITGYCFNQNYDPPTLTPGPEQDPCRYKRLVGTPELLYELAQCKWLGPDGTGISAQELYDHVVSMIYHRDDIRDKYEMDDQMVDYIINMAIKQYTDGEMRSFKTTDENGKNLVIRRDNDGTTGPVVYDENGYYQFRPGGSVLGSIVGHANAASSSNPDYVFPQYFRDAWHELLSLTDHPDDYYLYIYYPDNFMTKEEGVASGWHVPAHYDPEYMYYADSYQCLMSGFTVKPVTEVLKVRHATGIEITKTWADAKDQDGYRPTADEYAEMVKLLADDVDVTATYANQRTITDNGDNTYTVSFANLPKLNEDKAEIAYTIQETEVEEYTADHDTVSNGGVITNTHVPETTEIEVHKIWDDTEDADGIRPESITVNLLADGEVVETVTVTPDENGDWSYTFGELPKYRDHGTEIVYTVTEDPVENYETEIDGYDITNKYEPETTEIEIHKTWDDADNQDGLRPESITVNLLADGEIVQTVTVTPDENGDWSYTFTDLLKNRNGVEIVYTVTEEPVAGYKAQIDGYEITNKHVPETVEINVTKTWNDGNNKEGKRPASITINLLADGKVIQTVKITPDEKGNWAHVFTGLPKYADGKEIQYTITEEPVPGYSTSINGFKVTNSFTPPTGDPANPGVWITLMAAALLGIAALALAARKRKTGE